MAHFFLVNDQRFQEHAPTGYHPERPERLVAVGESVAKATLLGHSFDAVTPVLADDLALTRVHDPGYVKKLRALAGQTTRLDGDTYIAPRSTEVALLAAGSSVALVDAILAKEQQMGLALLRPPGHHATRTKAMGFCLVNNVAVAAAHAVSRGLSRVAIVDFDVHHGNGTQDIFYEDPSVLYVSTHQFPFYPGTGFLNETGAGKGRGTTLNVPLSEGADDAIYAAAFERIVVPALIEYKPELILVSAGFDAAARDPLAGMELSSNAYGYMSKRLADVANETAKGRLAMVLEGGYDLTSLCHGLLAGVEGLAGKSFDMKSAMDEPDVARAAKVHAALHKSVT